MFSNHIWNAQYCNLQHSAPLELAALSIVGNYSACGMTRGLDAHIDSAREPYVWWAWHAATRERESSVRTARAQSRRPRQLTPKIITLKGQQWWRTYTSIAENVTEIGFTCVIVAYRGRYMFKREGHQAKTWLLGLRGLTQTFYTVYPFVRTRKTCSHNTWTIFTGRFDVGTWLCKY